MGTERGDLTAILNEARSGGAYAAERLVRASYGEPRRTAGGLMCPGPAQVVSLRFFGALSVPEVAATLAVSDTAIESGWRFAPAWLDGHLGGAPG